MDNDYQRELDDISKEGFDAYKKGKSVFDNPFKNIIQLGDAWESGWTEASFLDEPWDEFELDFDRRIGYIDDFSYTHSDEHGILEEEDWCVS